MSGRKNPGDWPGAPGAQPCPTPLTLGSWPPPWTPCPWGSAAPPGTGEISLFPFQIKCFRSCGELYWGSEIPWSHGVSSPFLSIFRHFFLLCGLVSNIFTMFFRDSQVCLERCDSYGDFGYLTKNQTFFILREICKRTLCPSSVTLALLFFLP